MQPLTTITTGEKGDRKPEMLVALILLPLLNVLAALDDNVRSVGSCSVVLSHGCFHKRTGTGWAGVGWVNLGRMYGVKA